MSATTLEFGDAATRTAEMEDVGEKLILNIGLTGC